MVEGQGLKKTEEYRRYAAECRALARGTKSGEHRNQLLIMAETWDGLAAERERAVKADDAAARP
jgi:hypothetical protein